MGEEVMETLERFFGCSLPYKPRIILLDIPGTANAWADSLWGTVTLSLSWPLDYWGGTHFSDWWRLLLTHELAHLFQMGVIPEDTLWDTFLGKILPPGGLQPMWFVEGLAVYAESRLSPRGRLDDPLFTMYMREEVHNGLKPLSLFHAYTFFDEWPGSLGCYVYGASFCAYLVERFGEHVLRDIVLDQNKTLNPFDLGGAVKRVTGFSLEELFEEWKREEEMRSEGREGRTPLEYLHPRDFYAWGLALSPDEEFLLYSRSHPHLVTGLRLYSLSTHKEDLIVGGRIIGKPSFSGDGKKIIYSKLVEGFFTDSLDLFLYDFSTGKEERITHRENAFSPLFWRGMTILFLSRHEGQTVLWSFDSETRERIPLFFFPSQVHPVSMVLAKDGKNLALCAWHNGFLDLALLNLDSLSFLWITQDEAMDWAPVFSEDGNWLYSISDRGGKHDLYAYKREGGRFFRLTDLPGGIFEAVVSSRGIYGIFYHHRGYDLGMVLKESLLWEETEVKREDTVIPLVSSNNDFVSSPYCPHRFFRLRLLPSSGVNFILEDPLRFQTLSLTYRGDEEWSFQYENASFYPSLFISFSQGEEEAAFVGFRFPWRRGWTRGNFTLSFGRHFEEEEFFQGYRGGWWGNFFLTQYGGSDTVRCTKEWYFSLFSGYRGENRGSRWIASYTEERAFSLSAARLRLKISGGMSTFEKDFTVGGEVIPLRGYTERGGEGFLLGEVNYAFPIQKLYVTHTGPLFLKDLWGNIYFQGLLLSDTPSYEKLLTTGFELSLRGFLGNDALPLCFTLGMSIPLDTLGEPTFYLSLEGNF